MKKLFLTLLIFVILSLVSSYIFITDKIEIGKVDLISANKRIAYRCLTQKDLLQQILKDNESTPSNDSTYFLKHNDIAFQFKEGMFDVIEASISYKNLQLNSFISFTELSLDSAGVEWKTEMKMSNNPVKRIQQYLQANKIHKSMSFVLKELKQFVSNKKNVYDLTIQRALVTDSLLVTTKTITKNYPPPQEYYNLIKKLQDYIAANGASSANYPMLNIAEIDSNNIAITVAVPINKVLPDKGNIFFKRMFPGNILTAEVKGGVYAIREGFKQLNHYVSDYQLVPPAIPFQSLVTNRLMETDTSKWMTKLYFPIY